MKANTKENQRARSNCEDICLISKFLDGSEAAFEELFHKYQNRLFSVCRHFLGSNTEAEDAVQDAFLEIYDSLKHFRGNSSFHTWAYKITIRNCISRMKKIKQSNEYALELSKLPSTDKDKDIDHIVIQQAISKLSSQNQIILILKYYEQLSIEEIAQTMECSTDLIKMRLHRARNAMSALLTNPAGGK